MHSGRAASGSAAVKTVAASGSAAQVVVRCLGLVESIVIGAALSGGSMWEAQPRTPTMYENKRGKLSFVESWLACWLS